MNWLLVLIGLSLLVAGGEALVRGASGLALAARVTPAVVGLTVVAAGTSMPELVVSVQAAWIGSPDLALGNVVGSNIFNIGAILGVTGLVQALAIQSNTVRLEWPIMALSACLLHLLARDGSLDRLEGAFFLVGLVAFVTYVVRLARQDVGEAPALASDLATASFGQTGGRAAFLNLTAVVLGIGLLAGGSTALVQGASALAESFGVPTTIIGLTIVAAGTSTPELVTSLVAVKRGQVDLAVGNVIGSNVFNVAGIAGVTALIHPLPVAPELLQRDNWWMLGATFLLFPLMWTGMRVTRSEAALLLGGFLVYWSLLVATVA